MIMIRSLQRVSSLIFLTIGLHSIISTNAYHTLNINSRKSSTIRNDSSPLLMKPKSSNLNLSRKRLFQKTAIAWSMYITSTTGFAPQGQAFEGGVGGLGKTKPNTGVVFFNDNSANMGDNDSSFTYELLAPDGTPVLVSFFAPWPLLKSSSSIESRAVSSPDSAFVLVAPFEDGESEKKEGTILLKKGFFMKYVFGLTGKYGMYHLLFFIFFIFLSIHVS